MTHPIYFTLQEAGRAKNEDSERKGREGISRPSKDDRGREACRIQKRIRKGD